MRLSDFATQEGIEKLRQAIDAGRFPGVPFEQAMKLILTDGIIAESGLPVSSVLALEEWIRQQLES